MSTRVVVIGAGHHGLVAALRLAEAGFEVLVLEAAPQPGGGVRTAELTLPGVRHDTCAGFFPLTAASPVFRRLELGLDWINPPTAMVHVLDEAGAAIGARLFGDQRATVWLAGSGAHADLSPQAPGRGVFALGLSFLAHAVGWPFPRGGAGLLTDALVARLRQAGGELRCAALAGAIELRRGRVLGVRLSGGERVQAERVICTASPASLLELLPPAALPGRVERRLGSWRYGLGTVKLDWALSGPVPWLAPEARKAGVVHVGGGLDEMVESLTQAGIGRFPERPTLVVGQQSLHDSARAPERKHTLYAYARVPQDPGLDEPAMAAMIERQIERLAPGLGELIEARSVRPPAVMETDNPSLRGGDLASGSCEPDQQLVFRPAPELCRGRTPIRGLYVAGAWVHPGPGVHGVSGSAAADAVLRDARRRVRT